MSKFGSGVLIWTKSLNFDFKVSEFELSVLIAISVLNCLTSDKVS